MVEIKSLEIKKEISREEFNNWTPVAICRPYRQEKVLNVFKANPETAFLLSEITKIAYEEDSKIKRANCGNILKKLKDARYIENKMPYYILAKQDVKCVEGETNG